MDWLVTKLLLEETGLQMALEERDSADLIARGRSLHHWGARLKRVGVQVHSWP